MNPVTFTCGGVRYRTNADATEIEKISRDGKVIRRGPVSNMVRAAAADAIERKRSGGYLLTVDGKDTRYTTPHQALAAFQVAITQAEKLVQLSHDPVLPNGQGSAIAFYDATAFRAVE